MRGLLRLLLGSQDCNCGKSSSQTYLLAARTPHPAFGHLLPQGEREKPPRCWAKQRCLHTVARNRGSSAPVACTQGQAWLVTSAWFSSWNRACRTASRVHRFFIPERDTIGAYPLEISRWRLDLGERAPPWPGSLPESGRGEASAISECCFSPYSPSPASRKGIGPIQPRRQFPRRSLRRRAEGRRRQSRGGRRRDNPRRRGSLRPASRPASGRRRRRPRAGCPG